MLSTPEEALFYTEAPTAIADVPPRLRPHVKSVRIRSAEVYDFYRNSARTAVAENISLHPRHFSRHLTKTLADSRNISHSFMSSGSEGEQSERCPDGGGTAAGSSGPVAERHEDHKGTSNCQPCFPVPDHRLRMVWCFTRASLWVCIEIKSSRGSAAGNTEGPMIRRQRDRKWPIVRDCRAWFQIQTSLAKDRHGVVYVGLLLEPG